MSVYLRFTLEKLKLDRQIHLYLELVSPRECQKHIYVATLLSVFKKAKNGTFARKKEWSYRSKTLACRHNLTANNMGWVLSGHTFSQCVKLKISKMVILKNTFDLITCSLVLYKSTNYVLKVDTFVTRAHQRWAEKLPVWWVFR